jgi:hypothetical protein
MWFVSFTSAFTFVSSAVNFDEIVNQLTVGFPGASLLFNFFFGETLFYTVTAVNILHNILKTILLKTVIVLYCRSQIYSFCFMIYIILLLILPTLELGLGFISHM